MEYVWFYSQLVYYHCGDGEVLCLCTVFVDYSYVLLCGCVALTLLVTALRCASELGVHQGSMRSESGYVWCSGVAFAL